MDGQILVIPVLSNQTLYPQDDILYIHFPAFTCTAENLVVENAKHVSPSEDSPSGTQYNVICQEGYGLKNGEQTDYITCNQDNEWTNKPSCDRTYCHVIINTVM